MKSITRIPFKHCERNGNVLVEYSQNPGSAISGLDALKGLNFDVELCIHYPTVNAKIEHYEGTGCRKQMGWIQIIKRNDITKGVSSVSSSIDGGIGNPYYAIGFPPEMYDSPMYNLGSSDKLIWVAETFLATIPSRMNEDTISFLAGFQWGYEEFDVDGIRNVNILPVKQIDGFAWDIHIPLLKENFPFLNYAEVTD